MLEPKVERRFWHRLGRHEMAVSRLTRALIRRHRVPILANHTKTGIPGHHFIVPGQPLFLNTRAVDQGSVGASQIRNPQSPAGLEKETALKPGHGLIGHGNIVPG